MASLAACVGVHRPTQSMAIYDFGLSAPDNGTHRLISKVAIEKPVAIVPLDHHKIRYRLAYNNTEQVFFYSQSRWAATPAELLAGKLDSMVSAGQASLHCRLKLEIETFDHVFQTAATSEGVVQLNAVLMDSKTRSYIDSQIMSANVASLTPNAQGGVVALKRASEMAIENAVQWANGIADSNAHCH